MRPVVELLIIEIVSLLSACLFVRKERPYIRACITIWTIITIITIVVIVLGLLGSLFVKH